MVSRAQRNVRRWLKWRLVAGWVALLTFLGSSLGLPLRPMLGMPSSACHCGEQSRAAGTCCCSKAQHKVATRSCCGGNRSASATPTVAKVVKSCCKAGLSDVAALQKPAAKTCAVDPVGTCRRPTADSVPSVVTSCGCGGPTETGALPNAEPRMLATCVAMTVPATWETRLRLAGQVPPTRSIAPETPPPKGQPSPSVFG